MQNVLFYLLGKEKNFDSYPNANTFDEEYDFNSIMHYGSNYFGKTYEVIDSKGKTVKRKMVTMEAKSENDGHVRGIGSKGSLTNSDIRRLNKLFKCELPEKMKLEKAEEEQKKQDDEKLIGDKKKKDIPGGTCDQYRQIHEDKGR